jgi:hypothetical protein
MTKRNVTTATIAIVLSCSSLAACDGIVLPFSLPDAGAVDPTGPGASSDVDAAEPAPDAQEEATTPVAPIIPADALPPSASGVNAAARIADLTDAERTQLCAWLLKSSPTADQLPSSPTDVQGLASGPDLGCPYGDGDLVFMTVAPSDCVANLQISACTSDVASLERCVTPFDTLDQSSACNSAPAACAEYESGTGCGETVLVKLAANQNATACSGLLPVEAGANVCR